MKNGCCSYRQYEQTHLCTHKYISLWTSLLTSCLCPAEPPQVTVELQQQEVVYGETVRFICQARGKPTPSVMWLHNARPLAPSPRHRLTSRVLRVSNVGPQDDGLYQCMAENGVGSSQASARLITVSTGKSDSCSFVRGLILSFQSFFNFMMHVFSF